MRDVYHSFDEISGIIDFAKEIGAGVCVSCDTYQVDTPMPLELRALTVQFIQYAKQAGVPLNVMEDHFYPDDRQYLI